MPDATLVASYHAYRFVPNRRPDKAFTPHPAVCASAVVEQSMNRQALAAQKAGISVGQYKAAMRMLPAQFTDVATQLAGGQSPWLILLQQGGQVKDSFGGMIPMFRGLAGALTLPMVGATSLAVATGALAYAWYQGNSTLSDFNKTLVLSGNQSGLTADRMLVLSRAGQCRLPGTRFLHHLYPRGR